MTELAHSPLQRQVARAGRRLFVQTLLNNLFVFCAVALGAGVAWFLIEPYLLDEPAAWSRWAVASGLLGAGVLSAMVLALWKRPTPLTAALSLDERFGLKERVTTSLMLEKPQMASPAGQALLADVNQRIAEIDVGSRFPIRVSWTAASAADDQQGKAGREAQEVCKEGKAAEARQPRRVIEAERVRRGY
jgi:hypothetical protein